MSAESELTAKNSRISIPLAVVLERTIDRSKRWVVPNWSVYTVVSGENLEHQHQQIPFREDPDRQFFFYGGLSLDLFKDGGEGYWYNLLSSDPYLFVACEGEPGAMEIEPFYVTANQDEAVGHLETDDIVLSIPMPEEIRELLEHYVVNHYQPVEKKKRKRRDWLEDSIKAGVRENDKHD
ncbi:MAG: DUF3305 domain-containing protein [Gammaproteobacteria bacterium]|jgi:hypothetical protein